MKVDERVSNYLAYLNTQAAGPARQPERTAGTQPAHESVPVEVALSLNSVQLAEEETRRERLDAIRRQLAEGSYNISGKDVATKILDVLKG